GHSRRVRSKPHGHPRPLRAESRQVRKDRATSALCHKRTSAPKQKTLLRSRATARASVGPSLIAAARSSCSPAAAPLPAVKGPHMRYCAGWKYADSVFLLGDTAATKRSPPTTPRSSFGELHPQVRGEHVEESLLKLVPIASGAAV